MARRRTQTEVTEVDATTVDATEGASDSLMDRITIVGVATAKAAPDIPADRMSIVKDAAAKAKQAVKETKATLAQAKKDRTAAKKAVDPEDDATLLAQAQAEQAVTAAAKAVSAAERKAKTADKKAETEAAKQKAMKEEQDEAAAFAKTIKNDGKEIVTRLEKAQKYETQADDHRLAVALKMAEVEGKFAEAKPKGLTFRKWCESQDIVTPDIRGRSWENVRKLLAVGKADNPQQALTDMREGTKAAVAKHRDKSNKPGGSNGGSTGPTETPFQRINDALNSMPEEMAVNAVRSVADSRGLKMVAKDAPVADDPLTQARNAVGRMTSNEFDEFIDWLEVFEAPSPVPERTPETSDDPLDIPASLRRS